jgi:hypothetical protein
LLSAGVEQLKHALGDRLRSRGRDRVPDLLASLGSGAFEHEPLPARGSDGELSRIAGDVPDRKVLQRGELEVGHRPMHAAVGRLDDQPARPAARPEVDLWPEQLERAGYPVCAR